MGLKKSMEPDSDEEWEVIPEESSPEWRGVLERKLERLPRNLHPLTELPNRCEWLGFKSKVLSFARNEGFDRPRLGQLIRRLADGEPLDLLTSAGDSLIRMGIPDSDAHALSHRWAQEMDCAPTKTFVQADLYNLRYEMGQTRIRSFISQLRQHLTAEGGVVDTERVYAALMIRLPPEMTVALEGSGWLKHPIDEFDELIEHLQYCYDPDGPGRLAREGKVYYSSKGNGQEGVKGSISGNKRSYPDAMNKRKSGGERGESMEADTHSPECGTSGDDAARTTSGCKWRPPGVLPVP